MGIYPSIFYFGIYLWCQDSVVADVLISPLNVSVVEHNPITLTCNLTGSMYAAKHFSWYLKKNLETVSVPVGILTSTCESLIVSINTSLYEYACPNSMQSTWTIKNVTRQDNGNRYQCNIETSVGNKNSDFTFINVQVPVSSVTMSASSLSVVTVKENKEAIFKCKTSQSRPEATVNWYKNSGTPGDPDDDVEITSYIETSSISINDLEEVTSTLRMRPTRHDNGMNIYCKAKNLLGQAPVISARKSLLNVHYPPDGPPVISGFSGGDEYQVIENTRGHLNCTVHGGNPVPGLTWDCYNSGSPQDASAGFAIKAQSWIAERGQDKTCTCLASHYSGNSSVSIRIKTFYPPSKPAFKMKSEKVSDKIQVIKGYPFSVLCLSSGNPEPLYTWTYPNKSTTEEQSMRVGSLKTNGIYICDAQNVMKPSVGAAVKGTNSSSIEVQMLYPPVISKLKNRSVVEGASLKVTCPVVIGNPPETRFEWQRNGQLWKRNQTFTIETISKNDALLYTCIVNNTMKQTDGQTLSGQDAATFYLNVLYKTSVTSFFVIGHDGQANVVVTEYDENIE